MQNMKKDDQTRHSSPVSPVVNILATKIYPDMW